MGSGRGHFLLGSATKVRTHAIDHGRGHTVFGALCVLGSVPHCLVAKLGSKWNKTNNNNTGFFSRSLSTLPSTKSFSGLYDEILESCL